MKDRENAGLTGNGNSSRGWYLAGVWVLVLVSGSLSAAEQVVAVQSSTNSPSVGEVVQKTETLSFPKKDNSEAVINNGVLGQQETALYPEVKEDISTIAVKGVAFENKIDKSSEQIVITEDRVSFYDEGGNLYTSKILLDMTPGKQWSSVTKSDNSKFVVINNIYKYNQKNESIEDSSLTVYKADGSLLWSIENHGLSVIKVSPTGSLIAGVPDLSYGAAPIYIYGAQGLITKINKASRCWSIGFFEDGEHFALITHSYEEAIGYSVNLGVYNVSGSLIWEQKGIGKGLRCGYNISITKDNIVIKHWELGGQAFVIEGLL